MLYLSLAYSKELQMYVYILFQSLSHCGLSQDTECGSLCGTVGPCC